MRKNLQILIILPDRDMDHWLKWKISTLPIWNNQSLNLIQKNSNNQKLKKKMPKTQSSIEIIAKASKIWKALLSFIVIKLRLFLRMRPKRTMKTLKKAWLKDHLLGRTKFRLKCPNSQAISKAFTTLPKDRSSNTVNTTNWNIMSRKLRKAAS